MSKKHEKSHARLEHKKNLTFGEVLALGPILMCLKKKSRKKALKIISKDLGYPHILHMRYGLSEKEQGKQALGTFQGDIGEI